MKKQFYQDFKLGILGGGQLGRMFIQACTNFNVSSHVLDPDIDAPCKELAASFTHGDLKDFDTVYNFGKDKDLITIEIEKVNVEALKKLQAEGTKVYPQPEAIEIIQDKRIQKQFYQEHHIPTAAFVLTDSKEDVMAHRDFLPAFNKLGKDGYDGRGVQKLSNESDLDKAFEQASLLEKLVDFEQEISVIVSRNPQGQVKAYPPVALVFHPAYNLVDYLLSPAILPSNIAEEAMKIAITVIEKLNMVGILAVEMFLTKDGKLLVNEVAPRPHNSGHQTINASVTSQYEQHLRAILGLPAGSTEVQLPSAMVNILGEDRHTGIAKYQGIEDLLAIEGVNLFLYGKKETKPQRKMGHITIVDRDIEALKQKVKKVKESLKVISQM